MISLIWPLLDNFKSVRDLARSYLTIRNLLPHPKPRDTQKQTGWYLQSPINISVRDIRSRGHLVKPAEEGWQYP